LYARKECIEPDLLIDAAALSRAPKLTWIDFDEKAQAKWSFRIRITG
jgi:hypothetical protein